MIKVNLDENTAELLDRLKSQLREKSNDGVVRKAIALLAQAVEISGNKRYFFIKPPEGKEIRINLD